MRGYHNFLETYKKNHNFKVNYSKVRNNAQKNKTKPKKKQKQNRTVALEPGLKSFFVIYNKMESKMSNSAVHLTFKHTAQHI